ncbi:MAG: D-2-hydroxyacid dehydrogenase, partial [Desulfobacterota bacterium]|nr:D-2-hydroxyacid dehydrogenase [Thermodesulfobacteriota bacterium]
RLSQARIAITNKVVINRQVMEQLPFLKLICVAATGMNNVDLGYAQERGIEVKNVAGYSTESVVQVTFSHVLYLLCQHRYYDTYAKTAWSSSPTFAHIGPPFYELAGKQWGIIGLGTIGRRVAEVARAFGCMVVYYSTSGKNMQQDIVRMELDDLLATSHIVTIHAPLNEQTQNLITYEKLQRLRDGSILVNMGRGGIVNEADLARILDERPLYAGIDVVTREPIDARNPLLQITHPERLSLTPHIGWTSIEARRRLVQGIADNIKEFLKRSCGA